MTITLSTLMQGSTATNAVSLTGGTAGQVPYQSAPSTTSFYGPGTSGNVLVSNGAAAPSYNSVLTITSLGVGTANSGVTGEIRASNEITAYYTSDARLKENVKVIGDPITLLNQIRGVYFDWTEEHIESRGGEDGFFVRKHDIGVIAQEIEAILPEIVATRDTGYKAVKYEKIVPLLIEAIKAQQIQIDQIQATLADLVNK